MNKKGENNVQEVNKYKNVRQFSWIDWNAHPSTSPYGRKWYVVQVWPSHMPSGVPANLFDTELTLYSKHRGPHSWQKEASILEI